jgi:DNA repair photolyase
MDQRTALRGRGAADNPQNRFERLAFTPEPDDVLAEEAVAPNTVFLRAASKTILTRNDSPDVGFSYSINPYMGCEHGCAYCYARPYHEYWGFSAGLDFESKILVKEDAPRLLRVELASPKWQPQVIAMSGVTDCYQPAERHFRLTRGCLEVLAEVRNPVSIITKSRLITRDIDILGEMATWGGAAVYVSITTLDAELSGKLEPRAARPEARLQVLRALSDAGIPVGVNAAPLIPGLTDHELPAILQASAASGASFAGYGLVRLPGAVEGIFSQWLERNYINAKNKVMNQIRAAHQGRSADSRFGVRMRGTGEHADQINQLFHVYSKQYGLNERCVELSSVCFKRPPRDGQQELFD